MCTQKATQKLVRKRLSGQYIAGANMYVSLFRRGTPGRTGEAEKGGAVLEQDTRPNGPGGLRFSWRALQRGQGGHADGDSEHQGEAKKR